MFWDRVRFFAGTTAPLAVVVCSATILARDSSCSCLVTTTLMLWIVSLRNAMTGLSAVAEALVPIKKLRNSVRRLFTHWIASLWHLVSIRSTCLRENFFDAGFEGASACCSRKASASNSRDASNGCYDLKCYLFCDGSCSEEEKDPDSIVSCC